MSRRLLLVALVAVVLVCWGVPAVAAHAGSYDVYACSDDGAGTNNLLALFTAGTGQRDGGGCVGGLGLYAYVAAPTEYVGLSGWQMSAPSGAFVSQFDLWHQAEWQGGAEWVTQFDHSGWMIWAAALCGGTSPNCSGGNTGWVRHTYSGLSGSELRQVVYCNNHVSGACATGSITGRWKNVRVRITDSGVPTLSNGSGLWQASGWVRGRQTAGFTAADSVGIKNMRFEIDPGGGGAARVPHSDWKSCDYSRAAPCPTPTSTTMVDWDTAEVPDGSHVLRLLALDTADNSAYLDRTVYVDNTAPAAPSTLAVTPSGWAAANSFTATWTNPGGQAAPIAKAHWKLCPAGQTTGCTTGSSAADGISTLPGLTAPAIGEWDLTVWLEDAAGNASPAAGPVRLRLDDANPNKPTITTPGRWLNANDPTYYDAQLATPGGAASGIAGYSITRDGSVPDATIDRAGATATYRIDNLTDGSTTVRARAISGAGIASDPAQGTLRVDRTAPAARLEGAGNPDVPHPEAITVTLVGADATSGMGAAPDDEPATNGGHVAYELDGAGWNYVRGDEAQIPVAGTGPHTLTYYVVDAAGNRSVEQTRAITVHPGGGSITDHAGFWDRAVNSSTFTAAKRFGAACPTEETLIANRDAAIVEPDPDTKRGAIGSLDVGPQTFRRDALVGFPLPAAPDCTVESATLRLYATGWTAGYPGRPISVTRASSAWDEPNVAWSVRPGAVGAAATATVPSTAGWMEWSVTAQVQAMYRYGDNGLYLRDSGPVAPAGGLTVSFCSRENSVAACAGSNAQPQLVVRFSE